MRILRRKPPDARPEEMLAQQHYSAPEFRARVAAAKLMNILWAKEPSQVHLDQSLYGAAFVLPQIARSAGWPKELQVLCLKTYVVLLCNYVVQFAILYFIAKENVVWNLFSGQMFLCDFGKDAASCPDGPNCIGPGGTVFTNSRYYSWSQWSARTFARDSMKALFPDELPDIARYADPGEYGLESHTCRMVCCMLFVVTVLSDLLGSFNLAWLMNSIESEDGLWIDWEPPKQSAWASKEHAKVVMNCAETHFVQLKIAGMPLHWKVLNWFLILLPKLALWKVTTEAGIAFSDITFKKPVRVGDVVCCYGECSKIGRTSMSIDLEVWVKSVNENGVGDRFKVCEATFNYVAIDSEGRPRPVKPA